MADVLYVANYIENASQPPTDEEEEEMIKILEEAEANGEIDLSQFCTVSS